MCVHAVICTAFPVPGRRMSLVVQKLRSSFVTGFLNPELSTFQTGIEEPGATRDDDALSLSTSMSASSLGEPSKAAASDERSLGRTPRDEQRTLYRERIWRNILAMSKSANAGSEAEGFTRGNWEIASRRMRMCCDARLVERWVLGDELSLERKREREREV